MGSRGEVVTSVQNFQQSQNDYLRDFLPKRTQYVSEILARYGPGDPARPCKGCKVRQGSWRCRDCFGGGVYCMQCFREQHRLLPFHKVEHWTGSHFEPAWLCQVGVTVNLGHCGAGCPLISEGSGTLAGSADGVSTDGSDQDSQGSLSESRDEGMDWEDEEHAQGRATGASALPADPVWSPAKAVNDLPSGTRSAVRAGRSSSGSDRRQDLARGPRPSASLAQSA